jgi:hypothetical protein
VAPAAGATGPGDLVRLGRADPVQLRRDDAPQSDRSVVSAPPLPAPRSGAAAATAASSQWSVDFRGPWPAAARTAFTSAVQTWSHLLVSSQVIRVEALWAPIGPPGLLGAAAPNVLLHAPSNTVYPEALLNAVVGFDTDAREPDIFAEFNSAATNVYFGTDGRPAPHQVDFRTIVLHELGHGLGFAGSAAVDAQRRGSWGVQFRGRPAPSPVAFDRHVVRSGAGLPDRRVIDHPQGSTVLADALTSGRLFWSGPRGTARAGGSRPQLYAPPVFEPGSSYAHLDEARYPRGDPDSLMTPLVGNGEVIHDPGPIALGMLEDQGWTVPVRVGSRFTALDPVRVLQTSTGGGVRVGAGGTVDVRVAGSHGVPADATAVVLNVTAVAPSRATDVRVYPTPVFGDGYPEVSNLNLAAGITRANLVTVPVGPGGRVRLRNEGGTVGLLVDLSGYYSPAAQSSFTPVDPQRLLDTREAVGTERRSRLGAGETLDLQVTGPGGPVPGGATAVVLTVTATQATAPTDVRVYPTPTGGGPAPTVSNLNTRVGPPVPNLVTVKLSADGRVRLRNAAGAVHLVADVSGWYGGGAGALYRPVPPTRVLDTRSRLGTTGSAPLRVGTRGTLDLAVTGRAQVPTTATAVALNVTGVAASRLTDVRVFPRPASGSDVPLVSSLNLGARQTAAALVVSRVGSAGQLRLYNSSGDVALVADVAGWFGPA